MIHCNRPASSADMTEVCKSSNHFKQVSFTLYPMLIQTCLMSTVHYLLSFWQVFTFYKISLYRQKYLLLEEGRQKGEKEILTIFAFNSKQCQLQSFCISLPMLMHSHQTSSRNKLSYAVVYSQIENKIGLLCQNGKTNLIADAFASSVLWFNLIQSRL